MLHGCVGMTVCWAAMVLHHIPSVLEEEVMEVEDIALNSSFKDMGTKVSVMSVTSLADLAY